MTLSPAARRRRVRRVAAVMPAALLASAWATQPGATRPQLTRLVSAAGPEAPVVLEGEPGLGDPVSVPAVADASDGSFTETGGTPSTTDIPADALAAYQRAASVMANAAPGCHVSWELLAAIGRIESDHGRYGAAGDDAAGGLARPGILGPVLDGSDGTSVVRDTDGGRYDGDARHDRAVGPMQFLPGTWAVMGVDADRDGKRDPQDLDDAALGAAVYLCSEGDDLDRERDLRAAVLRYNHSEEYVDLVLAVMRSYASGDFSPDYDPATTTTVSAGSLVEAGGRKHRDRKDAHVRRHDTARPEGDGVAPTGGPGRGHQVEVGEPDQPSGHPVKTGHHGHGGHHGDDEPEPGTLTPEEAADYCADQGYVDDPAVEDDDYDECVADYTDPDAEPVEESPSADPSDDPTEPSDDPSDPGDPGDPTEPVEPGGSAAPSPTTSVSPSAVAP